MELRLEKRGHKTLLTSNFYKRENVGEDYWVSMGSWKGLDYSSFRMNSQTYESKREADTFFRKIANMLQSNGYIIVNKF